MKISRIEHMCEGNGHVIIKELLDEKQPGCSLVFNMHYVEIETYYILNV